MIFIIKQKQLSNTFSFVFKGVILSVLHLPLSLHIYTTTYTCIQTWQIQEKAISTAKPARFFTSHFLLKNV